MSRYSFHGSSVYRFDEVSTQRGRLDWPSPGCPLVDGVGNHFPRTISSNDTPTTTVVLEAVTTGPGFDETLMFGPDSDLPTPVIVKFCLFPFGSVLIPISHNPYEAVF